VLPKATIGRLISPTLHKVKHTVLLIASQTATPALISTSCTIEQDETWQQMQLLSVLSSEKACLPTLICQRFMTHSIGQDRCNQRTFAAQVSPWCARLSYPTRWCDLHDICPARRARALPANASAINDSPHNNYLTDHSRQCTRPPRKTQSS